MAEQLTEREKQRVKSMRHCRKRILMKIKRDPNSSFVSAWEARLAEYDRAEQKIALRSQLRAVDEQ